MMDDAAQKQYWEAIFQELDRYTAEVGPFPECDLNEPPLEPDDDLVFPEDEEEA